METADKRRISPSKMKNLRAAIAPMLPTFRSVTCYWIVMSATAMCAAFVLDASAASGLLPRHAVFGAALQDSQAGPAIARVIANSAAAKAGLDIGDVIVDLD